MRLARLLAALALCLAAALPGAAWPQDASSAAASAPVSAPKPLAPHTAIPFKQEKQSSGSLVYQTLASLVLVGFAAFGIAFGLKRTGWTGGGLPGKMNKRLVRLVETNRISRRSVLHVVNYRDQELLLAESDRGVHLVSSRHLPQAGDEGKPNDA